jgi:hypothetical protein
MKVQLAERNSASGCQNASTMAEVAAAIVDVQSDQSLKLRPISEVEFRADLN